MAGHSIGEPRAHTGVKICRKKEEGFVAQFLNFSIFAG
jgi:hypothetical protein